MKEFGRYGLTFCHFYVLVLLKYVSQQFLRKFGQEKKEH